jgi:hypothetical protein
MSNSLRTIDDYELYKHIPPEIKHNRIPAPEMSFTKPNLPTLIREIEAIIAKK